MIRYVHQSLKFVKHLAALCNGGKKAAVITQKAKVPACRQDDPEEDLPKGLDDKELRRFFCGITKETA